MKQHANTLFITTEGSYLAKEGEAVLVKVERAVKLRVPIHNLGGIVCFGRVGLSPSLMGLCGERGVSISMLTTTGMFRARINGFTGGNVLLRRQQYRMTDDPKASADIARAVVSGKIANGRSVLLRALRDNPGLSARPEIEAAIRRMGQTLEQLQFAPKEPLSSSAISGLSSAEKDAVPASDCSDGPLAERSASAASATGSPHDLALEPPIVSNPTSSTLPLRDPARVQRSPAPLSLDTIRGLEGECASAYFGVFDHLIVSQKLSADGTQPGFAFRTRSRRPPLDPVNALLSFLYAILGHDARSACECVGLDPQVGFLHRDRPGRAGLALDLMEEFRPYLADRLAFSLINRRQVSPGGFETTESGAVRMDDATRKTVLVAYQKRKQEEVVHPYLGEKVSVGLLIHLQARLLARHIRGELDAYPAFIWK